jgi:Glycosyl hydrolase catalytic core
MPLTDHDDHLNTTMGVLMKICALTLISFLVAPAVHAQMQVYDGHNLDGRTSRILSDRIYSGDAIPNALNKRISSFTLQYGYQAVLAENEDGTGASRVYVAAKNELRIRLTSDIDNSISFVRVLPFRNHSKKGLATADEDQLSKIDAGWFYHWAPTTSRTPAKVFFPMAWGKWAADSQVDNIISIGPGSTELLAFNEPDPCDAQSGVQLCDIDIAIASYRKLLRAGLRMGSPAVTQGQWNKWLLQFMRKAYDQKLRVDFIAVHWYDWGGWGNGNNRAESPDAIIARFKRDMEAIHNLYGMPIRITEFNANKNRWRWVQDDFLKLAMPWMEQQPWIEGYSVFQSNNPQDNTFLDENGNFRVHGKTFNDFRSGPYLDRNLRGESSLTQTRP